MITQVGQAHLLHEIAPLKRQLKNHTLYRQLDSLMAVQTFMSFHVFAVWDFMSLLKSLQQTLSCTTLPWMPGKSPESRRLINEIVLGEESDLLPDGRTLSHFEWYLEAMQACGASTDFLDSFLQTLASENSQTPHQVLTLLKHLKKERALPVFAADFLTHTWSVLDSGKPHCVAAAFTLGREDIIPDMFCGMVENLSKNHPEINTFVAYLQRHIELDGDSHGPMALHMLNELCEDNEQKWQEAITTARQSLIARNALWNGIQLCLN